MDHGGRPREWKLHTDRGEVGYQAARRLQWKVQQQKVQQQQHHHLDPGTADLLS